MIEREAELKPEKVGLLPALVIFEKLPVPLSICHWYCILVPAAVMLKLVFEPSHIVTVDGAEIIEGSASTIIEISFLALSQRVELFV